MTQKSDATNSFNASVIDEEALRVLRAVQRTPPQGGGAASANLAGGAEAMAGISVIRGNLAGPSAIRAHEVLADTRTHPPPAGDPLADTVYSAQVNHMPVTPNDASPLPTPSDVVATHIIPTQLRSTGGAASVEVVVATVHSSGEGPAVSSPQ